MLDFNFQIGLLDLQKCGAGTCQTRCLYQFGRHTIKEFYKISLSDINIRRKIPSFTDLLFPTCIFSIFIVNIVPFLVNDFTTIYV